jgi:multiple sugar transport system ATP-binding protein
VGGTTLQLEPARKAACLAAGVAEVGVRPEDIHFGEPGQASALSGEVYVVEPMGNETLVDVRIGGERIAVRTGRRFAARVGSTVGLMFDTTDACFFNSQGSTVVQRVRP